MILASVTIGDISQEGDIFIIHQNDDIDVDGEKVNELFRKLEELAKGKKYKTLTDISDTRFGQISKSAYTENRKKTVAKNRVAEAFVVRNLSVKLLTNFYHKVFKPKFPSKAFTSMEEAKKWLANF